MVDMDKAVFLSAGVPMGEGMKPFMDADPFLIHLAVREFITTVLGRRTIVYGGHPAITPMIWAVCEDIGVNYSDSVVMYQSRFFDELYPDENKHFKNVEYIEKVSSSRAQNLFAMRQAMLSRGDIEAAVFIGGKQGILEEWNLFHLFHPAQQAIAIGATGGASRRLAAKSQEPQINELDFVTLFHERLQIPYDAPRFEGSTSRNRPKM